MERFQETLSQVDVSNIDEEEDHLRRAVGIDTEIIQNRSSKQYWHKHLGHLFEKIVKRVLRDRPGYSSEVPRLANGKRMCDVVLNRIAIEAKYRVGSHDSGTRRNFQAKIAGLANSNYTSCVLHFRSDLAREMRPTFESYDLSIIGEEAVNAFVILHAEFDLLDFLRRFIDNPDEEYSEGSLEADISALLHEYRDKFSDKLEEDEIELPQSDILADCFGLTPEEIRSTIRSAQTYNSHLGGCWEELVRCIFSRLEGYEQNPDTGDNREPCDIVVTPNAYDTKYSIQSRDGGTTSGWADEAEWLQEEEDLNPILLIMRDDPHPDPVRTAENGGWEVLSGDDTFERIQQIGGFDLREWLTQRAGTYSLDEEE